MVLAVLAQECAAPVVDQDSVVEERRWEVSRQVCGGAPEARRGMACSLGACPHVGPTFRAAADALDDDSSILMRLDEPHSQALIAAYPERQV